MARIESQPTSNVDLLDGQTSLLSSVCSAALLNRTEMCSIYRASESIDARHPQSGYFNRDSEASPHLLEQR